jgi:L-ascorbate metabolism protein UlaG (beta-lactamase superfamily)
MSENDAVYLAGDTKLEPLVFRWYAWGHLVSPVQLSLNLAFRHMPLIKSFIANPGVHEAAAKNPKMLGGSFAELARQDLDAARALQRDMLERGADLLGFAGDLMDLDKRLQASETGFSLDHVYGELPASLSGRVEALYDLNQHPTLRVIEELVYGDALERAIPQQLAFSTVRDDARNFFLNTPRLDGDARLVFEQRFDAPLYDLLSAARTTPVPFDDVVALLGPDGARDRERLRAFFRDAPPARQDPEYAGDDVRVRYFGHACVLVQSRDVSILVDPFFTWDDADDGRLTFHDLPDRIDYVFLTHNHQDHFSVETLLQLRNRIGTVLVPRNNANSLADPSMKLALHALGHTNVRVMDPMERIAIPDGALTSLPFYGEHADLSIGSKHSLHLALKGRSLAFLADSDGKDRTVYRRIVERIGPVDVLFIGMECDGAPLTWLYGPYLSKPIGRKDDASRRLSGSDSERAWSIVEELRCRSAFVYAMAQEPWLRFVAGLEYDETSKQIVESDRLVARCREHGLSAERLCGSRTTLL